MEDKSMIRLDGRFLYYAFIAGSANVVKHQSAINKVNVFPVKDNDTGNNLASTMRSVFHSIKPDKSYKSVLNSITNAALKGSRGNSGLIFAQLLYGMNCTTKEKDQITIPEFAISVEHAIPYIYMAVSNPVEGTILTVIRRWSEFLTEQQNVHVDFNQIISGSISILKDALLQTKEQLDILQRNNCEDAGAMGFMFFIEGIVNFIKEGKIKELYFPEEEIHDIVHSQRNDSTITYRYCTEAIITSLQYSVADLEDFLKKWGDSIVIAGGQSLCRMHIHTDTPELLFEALRDYGVVTYQKIEDIIYQDEIATKRKWNIALVTDSCCDLPKEILDKYQIHVVPLSLYFGERHYLDKVTIQPNMWNNMMENCDERLQTSEVSKEAFLDLYMKLTSHYDSVIAVHLTSEFSETYNNSSSAAQFAQCASGKPIHVFDSKNVSGALGLIVLRVAEYIEKGKQLEDIVGEIRKWIDKTSIFVSVKNLKYMLRSGYVPPTAVSIIHRVGINPIVTMNDGKAKLFGYSFSQQANIKRIINRIEQMGEHEIIWNYILLHTNNIEGALAFQRHIERLYYKLPVDVVDISPVIGINAGIGAVAIAIQYR